MANGEIPPDAKWNDATGWYFERSEGDRMDMALRDSVKIVSTHLDAQSVIETLETIRYVCKNCRGGHGMATIDGLAAVAISKLEERK